MERKSPEYILEVFADYASVKQIVKGILHTIFFHRYFPCIRPSNIDVLDLTLPRIEDVELETLIDTRVSAFVRNHLSSTPNSPSGIGRGRIAVQFFDKRPRRVGMWFGGLTSNETEVCWETWTISVTIASPRTESERIKLRKAMERMLQTAIFNIVSIANKEKDHIPPIRTNDTPFPYQIILNPNPKMDRWRIGWGFTD